MQLKIVIDKEIDWMKFVIQTQDKTIEELISRPNLLWDPVVIDNLKNGHLVKQLFGSGSTLIIYDNLKILWNPRVWPPSIDALWFAKTLSAKGYLCSDRIHSVVDLGCGTGFLGLYMGGNNNVERVILTDIDYEACHLTRENAHLNKMNKEARILIVCGSGYRPLKKDEDIDLIVCAPPYIPYYPGKAYKPVTAFGGTHLLETVIREGENYAKELIVLYSNIAEPEVQQSLRTIDGKSEIVSSHRFPFRVPHVLMNERWLEFLHSERNLEDKQTQEYRYWHTLIMRRIIFST